MSKEHRRHRRVPQLGLIRVSWQDSSGQQKYVQAKLFDISSSGLRMMEVPEPIPPLTNVHLACEKLRLAGSAWVRHCSRYGAKYVVGVELTAPLKSDLLRERE